MMLTIWCSFSSKVTMLVKNEGSSNGELQGQPTPRAKLTIFPSSPFYS